MNSNEYIKLAYDEALKASVKGEVPIGAVIVKNGKVISKAHNLKEEKLDISSHAEILALKEAAQKLGTWKLEGCIMYVTIEPCLMCYSAIVESRIGKVFYSSAQQMSKKKSFRYYIDSDAKFIEINEYKEETEKLMKDFFKKLRSENVRY